MKDLTLKILKKFGYSTNFQKVFKRCIIYKNDMQILGLILLIATSWYIFKLTSNFLDDQTKKELDANFELFKKQFNDLKNRFSRDNLKLIWEKYKEERKTIETKDD